MVAACNTTQALHGLPNLAACSCMHETIIAPSSPLEQAANTEKELGNIAAPSPAVVSYSSHVMSCCVVRYYGGYGGGLGEPDPDDYTMGEVCVAAAEFNSAIPM